MRLRHWFATLLSLGLLLSIPTLATAQNAPADGGKPAAQDQGAGQKPGKAALPQPCVDAGLNSMAECRAFLAKEKAGAEKPAAPAAETAKPAEAAKPAAEALKPAAEAPAAQPEQAKPPRHHDNQQTSGDQQGAAGPAANQQNAAPAENQSPAKGVAPADQAQKPARVRLPKDCVAAGITTAEDCNAFRASNAKPKEVQNGQPAAAAEGNKPAKPAPHEKTAGQPAVEAAPANTPAVGGQAPAANQPAANEPAASQPAAAENGKPQRGRLSKDCIAAGVKTPADCDALHAINGQKGKGQQPAAQQPAAVQPTAPVNGNATPANGSAAANGAVEQPGGKAPSAPGKLPAEITPAKPEAQKPAEPASTTPALPDISTGLNAAAKSFNHSAAVLAQGGADKVATDKARADIKAQQGKIDALCKSNKFESTAQCLAQNGVELAPVPAAEAPGGEAIVVKPVQPVEVIPSLPKGVTPQEVAPLLDSAKEQETGKAPKPGQRGRPQRQPGAEANNPPPSNDKAAQAALKPVKIAPIDQTKGQQIDASAGAPQVQVPQNVTIVNQTTINNTTTVTNNTQNNNGPGMQQNNGAPGNQPNANGPNNGRGPGNGNGGPGGFAGNGRDHGPGRPGGFNRPGNEKPNPIGLGLGVILQLGNQLIINSPAQDQQRIADSAQDHTSYEKLPGDRYRETISRPNGVRIVTVYNRNGDILQRSRFDRNNHETVLAYFDSSHDEDLLNWRDPGDDLPPLQLHIPARDYVLDADGADETQVQDFFAQPPVEQVQRLYSIDEVKRSARIRDMVRRLEIGDLTFDTGAATISQDQVGNLANVAQAMLDLLQKNPAETFLIEGHTDAVGSAISNLQLSDARAATVAQILTDFYHIPPENLATQGYGERFLIVQTDGPERLNRRVTIRRITPLVTVANQNY